MRGLAIEEHRAIAGDRTGRRQHELARRVTLRFQDPAQPSDAMAGGLDDLQEDASPWL